MKKQLYILILLFSINLSSQNTIDTSIFTYNLNLVNPSFSGRNEKIQVITNYKSTWSGINNSLNTSTVSISAPIKKGIGMGLSFIKDDFYLFSKSIANLDVSYAVLITEKDELLFGLRLKESSNNVNMSEINTKEKGDNLFSESISNDKYSTNFSFGMAIKNEKYFFHIAMTDIIKGNYFNNNYISKTKSNKTNCYLGGGLFSSLNKDLKLKSSILFRLIEGAPLSFDMTSMINVHKKVNTGLTYRWNSFVKANIFFDVTEWAQFGYNYGLPINTLSKYINGSHEFSLKFHWDRKDKQSKSKIDSYFYQ